MRSEANVSERSKQSTQSLVRRIVAAVLGLELLCAAAFSSTALWHERRSRLHAFDAMLQGRSDSLLGAVQDANDPNDNVAVDPTELRLPKEDVYAVYNQGGRFLGGSPNTLLPITGRGGDGIRFARLNGRDYRVLEREALRIIDREENGGVGLRRPVTIVYAAPTAHVWQQVWQAAGFYALVSLLLVGSTAVLLVLSIRRSLQPIEQLAAAAGAISVATLSFTPPSATLRTRELRPLGDALSALMTRLREAFAKEHRFVGDAAHELKTAVAVVRSGIQVLALRPRSAEEYRRGLDLALADTERVEALVSRMLSLAQFEERPESFPAPLALAQAIQGIVASLNTFALAHEVCVETSLCDGLRVNVSAEAMGTLISNLLVNAIQHSPRGASVSVRAQPAGGSARLAVIEVEDRGHGIAEASLPHVFERFYREDTSRSRETGGAGLGLAICKSIADAAAGTIDLRSVQGQGTTVRAVFRLA